MFNCRRNNVIYQFLLFDGFTFFFLTWLIPFKYGGRVAIKEESWRDNVNWNLKIQKDAVSLLQIQAEKIQIIDRNFKTEILIIGQNECDRTEGVEEHPSNGKGKKGRKGEKILIPWHQRWYKLKWQVLGEA